MSRGPLGYLSIMCYGVAAVVPLAFIATFALGVAGGWSVLTGAVYVVIAGALALAVTLSAGFAGVALARMDDGGNGDE
jgi:hypothetical protein